MSATSGTSATVAASSERVEAPASLAAGRRGRRSGRRPGGGAARPGRARHRARRAAPGPAPVAAAVAVVAAIVPIVTATVGAVRRGWLPIGDNAFFALRAGDVFTEHHPLLGTWTSASLALGRDVNNPGPLLFDVLAVPTKAFGPAGVGIGAALLNVAAIVTVAVLARRRGGPVAVAATMVGAALLVWTMGSELLFDPWQPHSLLLAAVAFLTAAWSVADGDLAALPVLAFVAGLLVQTHLTYVYVVPLVVVAAMVALTLDRRRPGPDIAGGDGVDVVDGAPARRATWRRPLVVTAAVLVVSWAQPVVEQLTGPGEGNLTRLLASAGGGGGEPVGPALGARIAGAVLALPPWWGRPSFADTLPLGGDPAVLDRLPGTVAAAGGLVALMALLALIGVDAHRRGDRAVRAAAVIALSAVVGGLVTAVVVPTGQFGVAAHQFRVLWAIGAFVVATLVFAGARRLMGADAAVHLGRRCSTVAATLAGVAVVAGALAVPAWNPRVGPSADVAAVEVVAGLRGRLGALADEVQPVLFDLEGQRFAEAYTTPLMVELDRIGVEFVVAEESVARQLGPSRLDDGSATRRVFVLEGEAALGRPAGTTRLALVRGLDADETAELDDLTSAVRWRLLAGIALNDAGREALAAGTLDVAPDGSDDTYVDADRLLATGAVPPLVADGVLDLDPDAAALFERWALLRNRFDRQTVAVFVGPVTSG